MSPRGLRLESPHDKRLRLCYFEGMFRAFSFLLLAVSWLCWMRPVGAALPQNVAVQLFHAHSASGGFQIQGPFQLDSTGFRQRFPARVFYLSAQNGQLLLRQSRQGPVLLKATRLTLKSTTAQGIGLRPEQAHTSRFRRYPHQLMARVQNGGVLWQNDLPAQTYVSIVLGSETHSNWPLEALKAQAVLTQTRLAKYHADTPLLDSTQQEAYLGLAYLRPESQQAVRQVWGQTLRYQGQLVTSLYHASCAGQTSDARLFGTGQLEPWLTSVQCPHCRLAPFAQPTITQIETQSLIQKLGGVPHITRRDAAQRPLEVSVGSRTRSGYQFWLWLGQTYGWGKAPGTRFDLKPLKSGYTQITSTGAGHGVGLCQWGAAAMAKRGKTYRQILRFYFPKASVL